MTTTSTAQSSPRPLASFTAVLNAVLILLVALIPQFATAASVVQTPYPALLSARIVSPQTGLFTIHGEGFSPGGSVYVSVVGNGNDSTGASQSFWTVATSAVYGPNGSQDPANGYVAAGVIDEQISVTGETVFGPNGSQDPANGYREASDVTCLGHFDVQAYDNDSHTWSNQVSITLSC